MTIERGQEWGHQAMVPVGIREAFDDRELVSLVTVGTSVVPRGGDLALTIGVSSTPSEGTMARVLDIDLLSVELTHGDRTVSIDAVAHVVLRRRRMVGGPWRGEVVALMNAQYLRGRDVAPRGHPNDGRFEAVEVDSSMGFRQRMLAWRRTQTGRHLPHAQISVRSVKEWSSSSGGVVVQVDGVRWGVADSVMVRIRPDAASVWV